MRKLWPQNPMEIGHIKNKNKVVNGGECSRYSGTSSAPFCPKKLPLFKSVGFQALLKD